MAISKSRIKTEKLVEESKESKNSSGSSNSSSSMSISDVEPSGLTDLLPAGFTQFSNFKDLSKLASKDIKSVYSQIDRNLTLKNLGDFRAGLNTPTNFNANPVNRTLGLFSNLLCGDGQGIDFRLRDIFKALEYEFGFLNNNLCGRLKLRNPTDAFLNSIDNLRKDYNALINLDKRILKNLQTGVNRFIKNLGLPRNLSKCMLDNALSNMIIKNRQIVPPGALNNLKKSLNPSICKKSDSGVPGYNRTLEKTKVTPILSGLSKYDEETMYAFITAILKDKTISNDIIMEVLVSLVGQKENIDVYKLLILIAYTRVSPLIDTMLQGDDLQSLTNNIHRQPNQGDPILDKILDANDKNTTLEPSSVIVINRPSSKTDMQLALDVDSSFILDIMDNDVLTGSSDPEKDFYRTVNLLKIADARFIPERSILNMGENKTLKNLAVAGSEAKPYTSSKKENDPEYVEVDGVQYLKVYDTISLMDQVSGTL